MAKVGILKVEGDHGTGQKVALTKAQLQALQRICNAFRNYLDDNCLNYALYRCNLTSINGLIFAVLAGSDDRGNLSELHIIYDMNTGETEQKRIKVKGLDRAGKELYNLLLNLAQSIPFSVGMLDFPVCGKFEKGYIMGYNKEPGTSLIVIEDSLDMSYFLEP